MKNTFLNKVEAERKVLSIVNKYTNRKFQLAGLSSAAIEEWERRLSITPRDCVKKIRELALICQSLSDRSHETFLPIDADISSQLESMCLKLDELFKISDQTKYSDSNND